MPAKRELTMRQIRYVLRLASEGVSTREIAQMLGVARSTIRDNLRRAREAGLSWPLRSDLTDVVLEGCLFANSGRQRGVRRRAEPVWSELFRELKRPGVNLMVLWEEYRAGHPEGYGYSRYVAAVVMLLSGAIFVTFWEAWVCLTQHKSSLRLADLSLLGVRHG